MNFFRGGLPAKWENFLAIGEQIPSTPFVAMKTLISDELQNEYNKKYSHYPPNRADWQKWTIKDNQELQKCDRIINLCYTDR